MGNRHGSSSRDELYTPMVNKAGGKVLMTQSAMSLKTTHQQKGNVASTLLSAAKTQQVNSISSLANGKTTTALTNSIQLNVKPTHNNPNVSHPTKNCDVTAATLPNIPANSTQNTLTRAAMQRPTQLNITAQQGRPANKAVPANEVKQPHVHLPSVCSCQQSANLSWHYATPPPSLSDTSASSTSAITFPCNNCSNTTSSSSSLSSSSSTLAPSHASCHAHCHYCHPPCKSSECAPHCCNENLSSTERPLHQQKQQQVGSTISSATSNNISTLITPSQSRPNLAVSSNDNNNNRKPVVKRKRSLLLSACMPLAHDTAATTSPLTPPGDNTTTSASTTVAMPTNNHLCCKNHNSNNNYRCYHTNCHCQHKQQQPAHEPQNFSRSCHHYCSEHNYCRTTTRQSINRKIRRNNSLRESKDNGHATQTKQFLPPADSWNSGAEWRLPYGWEVAIDQTGRPYFINHEAKYTTYDDPRTVLPLSPPPQPRIITLVRDPTIGFGFVASAEKPVVVRFVTEGGPSHGKLLPGDQVLQVNGEDVENAPREHVINLVRSSSSNVVLRVCQPPPDSNSRKSALQNNVTPTKAKKIRQKNRRVTFADHGAAAVAAAAGHTPSAPQIANSMTTANQPQPQPSAAPSPLTPQPFVPNVLKVFLENGQTKSFKYDAKTTVGDVMASLKEKLSVRHIEHFALAIENVRSQRRNLLHFLQTDETITSIAARPTAQYLRCLFRLMFTPHDVNTLLQRDPVAFEYFYMQCCNDVVEERYANELRVDIALRLAALHMQQHAIANNLSGSATNVNKNVTVKLVEKECGLERFVPASILTTFNRKELRKILTTFIKLNAQYLAAPGQKRVGEMQAKLSYIKLLSELPSFGGKCFNLLIYPPNMTFGEGNGIDSSPSSGSTRTDQQQAIEALMLMSPKYGISQITSTPNGNPIQLCHLHDVVEITVRPNRNAGPSANAAQSDIDATLVDMRVAVDNVNSTILTVGTESRDDLNDILCLLEGYAKCEHHKLPIHRRNDENVQPAAESMNSSHSSLTATMTTTSSSSSDTLQGDAEVTTQSGGDPNNNEYGDDDDEEEDELEDEQLLNREPAPPYYGQHAVLKLPWNFVHGRHVMSITLIDPDAARPEQDIGKQPQAKPPDYASAARRGSKDSVTQVNDDGYTSSNHRASSETDNGQRNAHRSAEDAHVVQHYSSTSATASDEYDSSNQREQTPKAERRMLQPPANYSEAQQLAGGSTSTTTTTTTSSSPVSASSYDNLLAAVCSDDSEQQARRLLQQQQLYSLAQANKQHTKPPNASVTQAKNSNNVTEIAVAHHPNGQLPNRTTNMLFPYNARDCTKFIDESATSSEVDTPVVDAPHVISYLLTSNNTTATVASSGSSVPFDYFSPGIDNTLGNGRRALEGTSGETAKLFYQALSKVPPSQNDMGTTRANFPLHRNSTNLTQTSSHPGIDVDTDDDDDDENSSASATPTSVAGRSPAHAAPVQNRSSPTTLEGQQLTSADALFHRSCSSFGLQSPMSPNHGGNAFEDVTPATAANQLSTVNRSGDANQADQKGNPLRRTEVLSENNDNMVENNSISQPKLNSPQLAQGEIIDLTLIPLPEPSHRAATGSGTQRKYSPPTIVIPPTPFRDDIDNMEQIFPSTTNGDLVPRRSGSPPTTRLTQQQQNRLARNAALLDETLQELDLFINQVTIPPPPTSSATLSNSSQHSSPPPHMQRSSSQDDVTSIRMNGNTSQLRGNPRLPSPDLTQLPLSSTISKPPNSSPTHHNVVVLGGHYNSPAGKPPPVGGMSPVPGMRSKSATRVGGATFSEARNNCASGNALPNGSINNRPSISGVERPMVLPIHGAEMVNATDANQLQQGSLPRSGARPRPPPRDRVRRKVLHTMLHKSLEDVDDEDDLSHQTPHHQQPTTESVSGEPTATSSTFAIPGSPCDLAVYMDHLAERTTTKLDKLINDIEWTAVSYCSSRPPEHNPAQMRVARDQLVCEARRFVSTSKSFVKSASMAFTHHYYNRPMSAPTTMSEEHALVYVESLKRCTDLITMMYYSAQLVARAAQNGEQAAGLMRGIMQVASTFRATVNASMGDTKSSELSTVINSGGAVTTIPVLSTSSSSLKELMCEATKLAASLTALMRTIRSTDMRDENSAN